MKQSQFEKKYQTEWEDFEVMLELADEGKLDNPNDFLRLYRRICHFQSLARARLYSSYMIDFFDQLVRRGHSHLYSKKFFFSQNILQFFLIDFAQVVRDEWRYVLLSTFVFLLPLLGIFFSILIEPDLAYSVMSVNNIEEMENMYNPANRIIGEARNSNTNWSMFGFYIMNNIGVAFKAFASGLMWGVGSLIILITNGISIGAVAAHLTNVGFTQTFFSFVIGHGSFELTAIVISGAAGLKMGFSLISPGNLTRLDALRHAAKIAIKLIYGVIIMLVIAAFLEAFWSSNNALLIWQKYLLGTIFWLFVFVYFVFSGRRYGH